MEDICFVKIFIKNISIYALTPFSLRNDQNSSSTFTEKASPLAPKTEIAVRVFTPHVTFSWVEFMPINDKKLMKRKKKRKT